MEVYLGGNTLYQAQFSARPGCPNKKSSKHVDTLQNLIVYSVLYFLQLDHISFICGPHKVELTFEKITLPIEICLAIHKKEIYEIKSSSYFVFCLPPLWG